MAEKVAIVTGAGSGIGAATVWRLADLGMTAIGVGRNLAKLESMKSGYSGGGRIELRAADVSDRAAVAALVKGVLHDFGRIDVLVNNAGVNAKERSLARVTIDEFERQVKINLIGAFQVIHAVLPAMRERKDGLIINISSIAAPRPSALAGAAYAASKAGVSAMSSVVAQEEGKNGIRSTSICPGEVDTPLLEDRPEPISAERRASILLPDDVAAAVAFITTLPPRAHVPEMIIKPTAHLYI
ncbi:MAG TPA: SDR family oxidoreductase [Planctomycetia bacterium]|nr:SDR family oxidoreductase [Planctomycetia bacterium]